MAYFVNFCQIAYLTDNIKQGSKPIRAMDMKGL